MVKQTKKVGDIDLSEAAKPELSRREREEIEKQRAREHYQKLHAQGKTEEARADLARLAIIRQQREEAAKKREEERKSIFRHLFITIFKTNSFDFSLVKEAEKAAKTASIQKAIGKRT